MEKVLQALDTLWPILAAAIGFTVWLIRHEGRSNFNAERIRDLRKDFESYRTKTDQEISDLETRITQIDSELVKQISDVRESLARIEGALGISKKV